MSDAGSPGANDAGPSGGAQRVEVPAPGTPITPAEGCSVEYSMVTANTCYYYIICASSTLISDIDLTDQRLSTCAWGGSERAYHFSGIEGADACSFLTNLCVNLPPDLTAEPACEVDVDSTPDGVCQHIQSCTQAVDPGYGVTAEFTASRTQLNCDVLGEDYGCRCAENSPDTRGWTVSLEGASDPCSALHPICFDGASFDIGRVAGTAGTCETVATPPDNEIECQRSESCTYSKPFDATTTLAVEETDLGHCSTVSGEWKCECSTDGFRYLSFSPIEEPTPETACDGLLDICREPALEGTGELTCSEEVTMDESTACQIDFQCEQSMIAGGQALMRTASGFTQCYLMQGGWECDCHYDHNSEPLELDAALSSPEACSEGQAMCRARMEL